MHYRDGATVVLFKDNSLKEVFLVFRSDYPCWVTTGGGIEPGETPQKAALREAYEETGFKVKITRSVGEYYSKKKDRIHLNYLFEGRIISGQFKPEYPGCQGKWFKVDQLPKDITLPSKIFIEDCLKQADYFKRKSQAFSIKNNLYLLFLHPLSIFKFIKIVFK